MNLDEPFASCCVERLMRRQAERMTYYRRAHDTAGYSSDLPGARALVIRFLADLRDRPIGHDILDAQELPASRAEMIEAFRLLIASEPRFRIREQLKLVGALLAQYQEGVGPRLQVQAAPPSDAPEPPLPDMLAVQRIERALSAVEPDRLRILRLFDRASEQARTAPRQPKSTEAWRHREQSPDHDAWMAR
jgi:hypothetical protein